MKLDSVPASASYLGTCTWLVALSDGRYVYNPASAGSVGYCRDDAFLWLSEEGARKAADTSSWIGKGARVERARP